MQHIVPITAVFMREALFIALPHARPGRDIAVAILCVTLGIVSK